MRSTPKRLGRAWPAIVLLTATYAAAEAPLRAVLGYPMEGWLWLVDWLVSALLSLDVAVRLWRPGVDETSGRPVPRIEAALDLLAVAPAVLVLPSAFALPEPLAQQLSWLVLLRLTKLLRMLRDGRVLTQTELVHPSVLRLVRFVFWLVLSTHWIACGWLWLRLPDGFSGRASPYVEALFWAVTTVATVGYGDITPADAPEMAYAMAVMVLGVGVYGYVIGNVAGLLTNRDAWRAAFQDKRDQVRAFMIEHRVPLPLRGRIEAHYRHVWARGRGHGTTAAIADLPDPLRAEVALHMGRPILSKVPFLRDADDELLRELAVSLRPLLIAPGEWVFRRGALGRDMFLIDRGSVEIVDADQQVIGRLGEGDFFGEIALLRGGRRSAGARAAEACQLFALDKAAFDTVLEGHPEFARHVMTVAAQRRGAAGYGQPAGP